MELHRTHVTGPVFPKYAIGNSAEYPFEIKLSGRIVKIEN